MTPRTINNLDIENKEKYYTFHVKNDQKHCRKAGNSM